MITINFIHDTEGILALLKSNDHYFGGADPIQQRKSIEEGTNYGAFVDNQMVGCIVFHKQNDDVYEIVWLAIHPDFQNQGIGTELLTASIASLPTTCKFIEVKTLAETDPDPGYARTREFYKRHGFVSREIIHPYPGWGDDNPCQIFIRPR
jgi:ribosomal protein S18 acetylase RimI-like enzyme